MFHVNNISFLCVINIIIVIDKDGLGDILRNIDWLLCSSVIKAVSF